MTHSTAWRQFRVGMIAADVGVVILTYVLADILRCHLWMRTDWPEFLSGYGSSVRLHMKILAFLPFAWPILLYRLGWYTQKWRTWQWSLGNVVAATAILTLLMAALALLFERDLYPRAQIAFMGGLLPATALAARGISGLIAQGFGSRQHGQVLIVGISRDAVRIRRLYRFVSFGSPTVLGHLRAPWETDSPEVDSEAILGDIDQLGPILERDVIDEVLFATPLEHLADVLPYVRLCEEVGVTAHVRAETMACHSIPEVVDFYGIPLLSYSPAWHSPELLTVKRSLDVLLAIIGIILFGPIMLICASVIKLTSEGPVLFQQHRSGLHGRAFWMVKFRTMRLGAEQQQTTLAHMNESSGPVFKIRRDPRITPFGRFLRRWSLDELPQLFNVIKGDMSIVGPRPPLPSEVCQYDRWQRRRLSMRPGLTCLWQIKGRHRTSFAEWMQLDLFYIDHWSLRLDFLIICKTITTVLSGTGA